MNDTAETGARQRSTNGRGAGWSYRSYTDDDRAAAIVAYYASGNFRRTAAQLGVPVTTLRKWVRDDVRPAEPARVLAAGTTLDAKLEAFVTLALAVHPADFPKASFLEHCQAIALLADMLVRLRESCRPVAARVADAARAGDRPREREALRTWLDRTTPASRPADGAGGVCPTCGRGGAG